MTPSQITPTTHVTKLTPRRFIGQFFVYPLWLFTEVASWIIRPPKITPVENARRSYETLLDPYFAATHVWEDYTEGYYVNGDETYLEAQTKQFDYILDQTGCGPGLRVFDMGCGNGRLLEHAQERGAKPNGLTVSRSQAQECQAKGLNVIACRFDEIKEKFEPNQFDIVIINGSSEHFVTEDYVLDGRHLEIRSSIVDYAKYLLKPDGKLFITCIHLRFPTDIHEAMRHPLRHRIGSYYFYVSVLVHMYSGWYPTDQEYIAAAEKLGFTTLLEEERTYHYYLTSLHWDQRFIEFRRRNIWFSLKFLVSFFLKDPRYFLITVLYAGYGVWTWQFRDAEARGDGRPSPMIHKWLMFDAPSDSNDN